MISGSRAARAPHRAAAVRSWVRRGVVAPVASVALALAALAVLPPAGAVADSGTPAAATGQPAGQQAGQRAGRGVDLRDDADRSGHVAPATARRATPVWRGRTLTYSESLPAAWSWSLETAVAKWNASGSRLRLVPATGRTRAQVTIGYGDTGGAAGLATVGRTRHAWVHLSRTYASVDALDSWNRVEVMAVLAHEIGHVLGFEHTTTSCSLMSPVLDVAGCGMFSPDRPGWYRCRTVDAPLAARLVRTYGGRARLAPTTPCLVDPMPSALSPTYRLEDPRSAAAGTSGTGTGTGTGTAEITWSRPAVVPAGSRVEVRHWSAPDCSTVPASASTEHVAPGALSWSDDAAADAHDTCFQAVLANRYGVARTAVPVLLRPVAAAVAPEPAATS